MALSADIRARIETAIADAPGAVLEQIAKAQTVTTGDVVRCLPTNECTVIGGEQFETVMLDLTDWGDVVFIVHTDDLVFEARGEIPQGSMGRGYYNLHGKPIGGHLKADRCDFIAFVSRQLFKKLSRSIQFYNADGHCMFKIYLGRDEDGNMVPDQIARFEALAERLG